MNRLSTFTSIALVGTISSLFGQALKPNEDVAYLQKAALQIDQQIASFYRAKKLPVPEVTDDYTFLRRAFLVGIGRIPTHEEAMGFVEIESPTKRQELVGYLMKSKGYSSHLTNWVFDLLRLTDDRVGTTAHNEPYRHWVRNALANNMPWDEFTHNLLTTDGNGWDQATAAVGYYTRDDGMPLDNLANTMRIFLGTRMECAQCHDDPFGETERHDFYELAAFTHGQKPVNGKIMTPIYKDVIKEGLGTPEHEAAKILRDRVYGMSMSGGGAGKIPLPKDYQYKDAKPGEVVTAKTPFGDVVRVSEKSDSGNGRELMAKWVISKTGDQYPSVIANRMWKRVMGKGIYEPVDTYIAPDKTPAPDLVKLIAKLMVDLDYDLRAFQHVLLLTRTFQFATNPKESIVEGGDDFHGRKIERLSAEQIWDSLITLADGDPDLKPMRKFDDTIYLRNRPVLVGKKNMTQLSTEVLALTSEEEVRAYFDDFVKQVTSSETGRSAGDGMMAMSMKGGKKSKKGGPAEMNRASEMPSPAPGNHFLFLFGASSREIVEDSTREPNVGQVLSLMNGFVQRELVNNPSAHLYKSLEGASSDQEKIRRLYLAILNRTPTDEEMTWMMEEVSGKGQNGYRNIVSALVMSSEFLFLQ